MNCNSINTPPCNFASLRSSGANGIGYYGYYYYYYYYANTVQCCSDVLMFNNNNNKHGISLYRVSWYIIVDTKRDG